MEFPIADGQKNPTVPADGMGQGGGVPGGMPANVNSDANDQAAQYQEQLLKLQRDIDRMRSTYDRNLAEREKQWKQERAQIEQRLHEASTKNMDEKDRVAYERNLYQQRVQEYEQRLAQVEQERAMRQQMSEWADAYKQLGIDPQKLKMSSPEEFQQSAWQAVVDTMTSMRQELETLKSNPQSTQTPRPAAPKVVTNQGGVPQTAVSFNDMLARFRQVSGNPNATEGDMFDAVDRGRFNLGI